MLLNILLKLNVLFLNMLFTTPSMYGGRQYTNLKLNGRIKSMFKYVSKLLQWLTVKFWAQFKEKVLSFKTVPGEWTSCMLGSSSYISTQTNFIPLGRLCLMVQCYITFCSSFLKTVEWFVARSARDEVPQWTFQALECGSSPCLIERAVQFSCFAFHVCLASSFVIFHAGWPVFTAAF